jgi:VanZ family protein
MPIETPSQFPLSTQRRSWVIALAYVASIYLTLGIAPGPLAWLRSHGLLRRTLATLFTLCWAGLVALLASRTRQWWRFAAMAVVAGIYFLVARNVSTPEEQVHFVQYGLVGVLFMRAVRPRFSREYVSYLAAFTLAFFAGWIDELIQGALPNRHYDVKDIALNAVSSVLGLIVYRIIPRKNAS